MWKLTYSICVFFVFIFQKIEKYIKNILIILNILNILIYNHETSR